MPLDLAKQLSIKRWSKRKVINERKASDRLMPHARDEAEAFIKPVDHDAAGSLSSSAAFPLASERSMSLEFPQADSHGTTEGVIGLRETTKLSFQFSILWVFGGKQAYSKL